MTLILAIGLAACTGDDPDAAKSKPPEPGAEGGPCYGNGTCNAGLACERSICVRTDAGGPLGDAGGACILGKSRLGACTLGK